MTNLDENKTYYLMSLKGQWYAVALESYQVTFLQQHINARAFNIPIKAHKILQAKKKIVIYDFTNFDDDQLIHTFFERQKEYKEQNYNNDIPSHLKNKCDDNRSLQDTETFKKSSPYNFNKKIDNNIYYLIEKEYTYKKNNLTQKNTKYFAISLELNQVSEFKQKVKKDFLKNPVNAEVLKKSNKNYIKLNFTQKSFNELVYLFKAL